MNMLSNQDGVPPDGRCIAILDTETSGLNVQADKLIELAIMLVWVDDDGSVTGHMGPVSHSGLIHPAIARFIAD